MRNGKISTQFKIVYKFILLALFFAMPFSGIAQYDYEHYVPPFYNGSSNNGDIGWHKAILSTNSINDVTVSIYKGHSTLMGTVTIKQGTPGEYLFPTNSGSNGNKGRITTYPHTYDFPWNVVGAKELNKVLPDQGLRFYSSDGPFFVNVRHSTDVQGGSLTTKGTYAYGTDFLSGHVYTDNNSATSRRSHFISVMATEDNTLVSFTDIKTDVLNEYNDGTQVLSTKAVAPTDIINPPTTLNKGESFIIAIDHNLAGFTTANKNGMMGTSITSDKPIAVNTGSWTSGPNQGQDMGIDQIVPTDQLRNEFIVMRGEGDSRTERPVVVAIEDNTEVKVNDVVVGTIAKRGEFLALPSSVYDSNGNAFIETDKNVYVYQTLSGSSVSNKIGPTVGMNFIPPVSTSGIREVTVPFADYLSELNVGGVITILVQSNAVVSYSKNGDETLHPISEITTAPVKISGHPEWEIYKLTEMTGNYRFYANKAINVAWLVESGYVGAAGYYSGFTKAVSVIVPDLDVNVGGELDLICESYDDDISVSIKDPLPDFYEWYVNDFDSDPIIENGPLVVPAPDEETIYWVVGSYRDPAMDQLFNGTFFEKSADSDYTEVFGNLQLPGEYTTVTQTTDADPSFKNPIFTDMDNDYMFMAISKDKGDTIYRGTSVDVVDGFNYIVKLYGRSVVNAEYTEPQNIKVLVNGDTIIDNFKIDDANNWQSVSALWKPGDDVNAIVKLLNNNPSGVSAAFALDSITFVQAVQDTAKFVARVIPNYSFDNNGNAAHFCTGVQGSIDISNGDTSWYTYSWSREEGGTYTDLTDGDEFTGTNTHELIFLDPQKSHIGKYKCVIGFKPEYQQCGSETTATVDVDVLVDDAATVKIEADKSNYCDGASATLNALVTGDAGDVKWYVNGGASPVSLENPFLFKYPAGTYTVRCEAENGCGVASHDTVINVLSAPVLNTLTSNDNLCEGQDIVLTADATGDGTLTYIWKKGSQTLAETGNVLNYTASILDRESTFKVKVTSVYNIAGEVVECPNSLGMAVFDLDIFPLVAFDKTLQDATVCEGDNHSFNVTMQYPGDFYTYQWDKDGVDLLNNLSSHNLSSVDPATDSGNYRVVVSNRCNTEFSAADLIVTPEIKVNGFSLDLTGPFCNATNVTATFDVDANGATYIYQLIEPGGTAQVITNPYTFNVNTGNEGNWQFLVSSDCDAPVIFNETLNMVPDFGALTLDDIGTCIGENVTFKAEVADVPAVSVLTYVWTDNLGDPIGTNSDELDLLNVQDANLGNYTVVVTDQCGNTKTLSAALTKEAVTSPATAAATTICEGDNFSTTITYLGSPTFEWRFGDAVTGPIVGTTETLNIVGATLANDGVYYCNVVLICGTNVVVQRELVVNKHISLVGPNSVALNFCDNEKPLLEIDIIGNPDEYTIEWKDLGGTTLRIGSFIQLDEHIPGTYRYTANVTGLCDAFVKTYDFTVHKQPVISAADNSLTECSGLVSLDVTVTGDHNGIVWWKDGAIITDGNADQTNYVIDPATSPTDDGEYIAKIESDYCSDYQASILLDVINTIVVTNQSPANTVVCENAATSLFVTATGDDIEYKWYKTADPATTLSDQANYDLGNILSAQAGEYKCDITNDLNCGNQTLTFTIVVEEHATVTNPASVTMCETDPDPVFMVTGTGEAPLLYQWFDKDDVAVAGATTNTLTVTSPVDGQSYYCVVTGNSCNTAKSNKASLTIIKNVSVTDPSDLTISDGANASFTVVASGEPDYTYQWQEDTGSGWNNLSNGGKYSGVDLAILHITGADKAIFVGNQYRCIVGSTGAICASSATSDLATLTVTEVTKIAVQPNGTTVCFNDNATLSVEGASIGLTYTWFYKKGAGAYETADGKDGMFVSLVGSVSTLTIPADDLDINNWAFQCVVSDGVSTDQTSNEVTITVLEDITVTTADATFTPCVNDAFSLSVAATGDAIKYKWYKVGAEATILSTSASYNLGNIALADAGTYKCEIYNDLACNDLERTFVVDVKNHATITNPVDVTMCASDVDPTFTANGTAEGTLTYEWFDKDDNLVVGATTNTLIVASPVNGQSYYAVASGDFCDDATSNRASLTVLAEVSTTNPVDVTIADGGTASFEVTASGEPTYSYQWQEDSGSGFADVADGGEYSGATTSKLTITGALDANGFDDNLYRCVVSSSSCSDIATSLHATLVLDNIIKILVQPDNQKLCETNTANFVVEGTGAVTGFTWKYDKGAGFVDADGQDGMSVTTVGFISTLSVPNTDPIMNTWKFKCVLTDGLTDDETNEVSLEVYETINVTTAVNNNLQKCEGESLILSVATDAGSNIQYKWYESTTPGTILSTSADYDLGNISLANELTYECLVYNDLGCGDVTISYTIDVQEDATVTNPADQIACASDTNIEFEVTGTAEGTVTFEWFDKDDVSVGNAAKLIVATPVHGQSYYCVVSGDACNDATSEIATLTVYEEVSIVDQAIDVTIPDGGNASFTVNVAGEPDYTYQWEENTGAGWSALSNGGKYSGVDSQTLTVSDADKLTFDTNQYRCVVGNTKCSADATSDPATLTITSVVKIFGQPENMEACLPNAVVYEIIGSTAGLTYEWEYSTDGVTYNTVTAVPEIAVTTDAAGSKLTIATTTLAMNTWTFHCIVKDGVSADETSSVVSLNVVEPVNFDALVDENLCFGDEKQISLANVSGTGPITYSWSDGVSEVSTTADLSIGASDNGNYAVTASNGSVCPDKTDDLDVLHYSALNLSAWSNTDQVCVGATEVLSVGIANKDALLPAETYQWYKDGTPISTDPTYSVVAVDKTHSGQYKVEVYDGCSTESISGYVNAYETIVATNSWDAATTICLGAELKLETVVTGDVISYTWTKDGGAIAGATGSTYLKAVVDASDAGTYVCTVTGNCGTPLVYTIDVTVLEAPEITTGLDALLNAVCENQPLTLGTIVTTGNHDDPVWTLNDNITNVVTTALELDLGTADLAEAGDYKVSVSNMCGEDVSLGTQIINPNLSLDPIEDQEVCQGDDVVFRANATGNGLTYVWTIQGVEAGGNSSELVIDGATIPPTDPNTSKTYNIVCNISSTTGCGTASESASLLVKPSTVLHATLKNVVKYVGENHTMLVDVTGVDLTFAWTFEPLDGSPKVTLTETGAQIDLTNIALTDAGYYTCKITGACGQRLASGKLTVKEPVVVNSGLNALEEKCIGDPLNLSLNVTGQVTAIRWYKDNVLQVNTDLNYFIASLAITDAGVYRCEIEGEGVSGFISETTTVRVYNQTVLNTPLDNKILCENSVLDWIPDVSGTSDLTYQWSLNGTNVFTGKILHYDALTPAHEGDYEVQVTSMCGDVSSSTNLEVIELPVYVSSTTGTTVCENYALVEFSVEYTGENLKYQWRKDGVDLPGETTESLSIAFVQVEDAGDYNCRVYSSCGEEFSPVATLTVTPQLKVLSDQADIEVCDGEEVVLVADVEGNNVTYQWKIGDTDLVDDAYITGSNTSQLTITNSEVSHSGYYSCIVSDDCTSSRSTKPTEVTVNTLPNTEIIGRMVVCAMEDRVTYLAHEQPDLSYAWGVAGGIFAGSEEGIRTRVTWGEDVSGALSVTLTDVLTGCSAKVDSAVVLNALPDVSLEDLGSKGICEEEFVLTGGFPNGGIYWVNGISETVFNPSDRGAGTYAVHYSYTDVNGCSNVTSIKNIEIDVLPTVSVIDTLGVGSCSTTQLSAETSEGNIQWYKIEENTRVLPTDLDDSNSLTPVFTPGESQVLLAAVQDEHGCEGIGILKLGVSPLPEITIMINDTTVSQCNQLLLETLIAGDSEDVISWTNPDHLDDANQRSPRIVDAPEGTHTYQISVTDLFGCDATSEVNVTMVEDPSLGEDIFACEGETFEVDVTSMENPFWSNPDWNSVKRDSVNNLGTVIVEKPGKYLLEVSNEYGCEDEQTFVINPNPILGLKDTLIYEGQTITLGPNLPAEFAPYFFEWQDGSILQRFEATEEGMYKLTVEDNIGCVAVDSAFVTIKPVGIESPNAFTPESNNDNSKFYLKDINFDIQKFEMYVYDRWGELLYQTNETGYNGGWDGKYKGKLCPTGSYVWIAFINGKLTNKGTFTLIR